MKLRLRTMSLLLAGLLSAPVIATAHTVRYTAVLTGDQHVPNVITNASGLATLELNDAHDALSIFVSVHGLDFVGGTADPNDDVLAFHIHRAPAGANGPVVFGFIGPNNDTDGDLTTLFDPAGLGGSLSVVWDGAEGNGTTLGAELANLNAGGLYFNIHTPGNPGGEIRGQILPVAPIPLPAGLWLMGSALAGLALRRKS